MLAPELKKQKIIIVEGNIGAGKSTFLAMIKRYLAVQIVPEPHTQWQQVIQGQNLLDMFYTDMKRWGYTFQSYAFVTRVMMQQKMALINPYPLQILERSVFSDRYCFAKNLYENGVITPLEWHMYQEWFSWLIDTYVAKPDGFIYMHTTPEVCFERMQKRDRSEEKTVPLEYLQSLHQKHEDWLIKKEGIADYLQSIPVLTIDCNQEFESDEQQQRKHIDDISTFCTQIVNCPIDYYQQPAILLEKEC